MKLKLGKRSLTIVVIPEANRGVVRFKLHLWIVYLVPMCFLALACLAMALYIMMMNSAVRSHQLASQLQDQSMQYEQTINDKQQSIEKLEDEILALTKQAGEVQDKVNKLKQLEIDLNNITSKKSGQSGQTEEAKKSVSMQTVDGGEYAYDALDGVNGTDGSGGDSGGVGGDTIPVTEDDIIQLADSTQTNFRVLGEEMSQLLDGLSAAKEKVIKLNYQESVTPNIWPTDSRKISSEFGYRRDPFTRRISYHSGMDIAANTGDDVYTTANGKIIYTGRDSAHGNNIIVEHTSGISTRYLHLSEILVTEGSQVAKGDFIGKVGSTGRSTGPHLHYEVLLNGATVNPAPYLP